MLEQLQRRLGLQTIPGVFFTSAGIALIFAVMAVLYGAELAERFGQIAGWVAQNLGWFYIFSVSALLVFLLGLAVSRFGNIRLGADDSHPDYSNLTWFTMLFAAGIGTILMFWGVAEPVSHFAQPPFEGVERAPFRFDVGGQVPLSGIELLHVVFQIGNFDVEICLAFQRRSGFAVNRVQVDVSAYTGPTMAVGWDPLDIDGGDIAPIEPVMLDGGRTQPVSVESRRSKTPSGCSRSGNPTTKPS